MSKLTKLVFLLAGLVLTLFFLLTTENVHAQEQCVLPLEDTYTVTNGPNEGLHHEGSAEAIALVFL